MLFGCWCGNFCVCIVDVVVWLVVLWGLMVVSLVDVVDEVGFFKSGFFKYFEFKEGMYEVVVDCVIVCFVECLLGELVDLFVGWLWIECLF